jgi:hypothetical protein
MRTSTSTNSSRVSKTNSTHHVTRSPILKRPGNRRDVSHRLTVSLELMARPRIKVRSSVDQRINKAYKQLTRHEAKAALIRLDMRKLATS